MSDYDIVVVGAGAAGTALAAGLCEDPTINVALIEAGQENPYDIGRSEGAFFLGGRVIQHLRGRAIGPHLSD
jgi:choline dehydrogenase-like flavoprotein